MDVRRAAGVGHRSDGAKVVAAVGARVGAAVTLEGLIAPLQARLLRMIVNAASVALPDLDPGAAHRLTALAQHTAADMGDLAHGLRLPPLYTHEVAIHVGWERHRIEGALGLPRRNDQIGACGDASGQRRGKHGGSGADQHFAPSEDGDGHRDEPLLRPAVSKIYGPRKRTEASRARS